MATLDEAKAKAHQEHLRTDCENVPDSVRDQIMWFAADVATRESRHELAGMIEAAYALVGEWENFLGGGADAR